MMNFVSFSKPISKYLINRFLGDYLKTEITTDQLELKLQDGVASLQNVSLNVECIDKMVKNFGIARVLQGYIDEISVSVPWTNIMSESTVIRVRGLELTLLPLQSMDTFNAQELATSMFSTTSNMELARSFINNGDEMAIDDTESGLIQLAGLFDQVINRIKIIFEKTTIRLETESDLAIGLEFQIERMEFVDEKLDACEQNQGDTPITSQPTSFSAVTELNKLLHIQGVRLYTDIWSNYKDSSSMASSQDLGMNESVVRVDNPASNSMISSNFQSCYSHFPEKKGSFSNSQGTTHSTDSGNSNTIPTNPVLIAQLFGDRSTLRIRVCNTALSTRADAAFNKKFEIEIQFVGNAFAFMTPTQLALVKELLSMLAPSSRSQSDNLSGGFNPGGQPMRSEHYAHVSDTVASAVAGGDTLNRVLMTTRDSASVPHSNAIGSNAPTTFYELQRNTPQRRSASVAHTSQKFTTISLHDEPSDHHHQRHGSGSSALYGGGISQASVDSDSLTDRGTQHGSNLTLTERRPDLIEFTIRAPGLVFLLTHDDPLAAYNIFGSSSTQSNDQISAANVLIRAQITKLSEMSAQFFKRAANIKLASWKMTGNEHNSFSVLQQQRQALISLYSQDHLKLICRQAFFQFHNECDGQRTIFDLKCKLHECDVSEFLTADSIHQPCKQKESSHFDILNFCDLPGYERKNPSLPHLQFYLKNFHERENHRRVEFQLLPCQSHLDLSILDRISHLIAPKPFYKAISSNSTSMTGTSTPAREDNPLSGLRENFMQFDDTQPKTPETYDLSFSCNRWIIDLRIPRADYTPSAPSYTVKNLHEEFMRLYVEDACLNLARFQLSELSQHGQLDLKCQSITGEFVGDPEFLKSDEHRFFHASPLPNSSNLDRAVKICIKYDNRNRQLLQQTGDNYLSGAMTGSFHPSLGADMMARSMYGSFCPQTGTDEYDEGPFTHARYYHGEERLISPGTRRELEEFAIGCMGSSLVTVELDVPLLNVYIPSHMLLEVLYNRFANDFALWTLRAPVFVNGQRQSEASISHTSVQPLISEYPSRTLITQDRPFLEFTKEKGKKKSRDSSSEDIEEETSKSDSHLFSLQVKAKKCCVLMRTQAKHEVKKEDQATTMEEFGAQLGIEFGQGQFFIVHGYNKRPGLDYLFVSAVKTHLFHRNLLDGTKPFVSSVSEQNFGAYHRSDIHAEPGDIPIDVTEVEDSVAVGIKILNNTEDNQRNITLAISVRNTLLHYRPVVNPIHYWPQQFSNFFDLIDYGVPGYEWPQLIMDLHVQLKNTAFGYDHSIVVPESPMVLKAVIGTCHFSTGIYQLAEKLKLSCLLEDTRVYFSKRAPKQVQFAGGVRSNRQQQTMPIDVKIAEIGLLHANLEYTLAGPSEPSTWDLKMKNDTITLWLCSDTVVELKTLLVEFMYSDIGKAMMKNAAAAGMSNELNTIFESDAIPQIPESISSASNLQEAFGVSGLRTQPSTSSLTSGVTAVSQGRQLTEEQQDNLKEMLSSAMEEPRARSSALASLRRHNTLDDESSIIKPDPASTATNQSDDDFVHLDEFLGSGITNARGEPKVRILEEDGFIIVPNHLRQPSEEQTTEMIRFPDDHPKPINTMSIEDFSLCVYIFGGADFSEARPADKTYSLWEHKKESLECMRDGSEEISKISFVRKLFASDAPTLSAAMLTIGDVEILDHLLISNINKFFYQYVDSVLPRRLNAPLLSVKTIEDHCKEGKLKISLLPLRLNVDQDTLEFLGDFFKTVAASGIMLDEEPFDDPTSTNMPIMEVNPANLHPKEVSLEPIVTWTKGAVAEDSEDEEEGETEEISVLKNGQLFDPFDESDILFEDDEFDLKGNDLPLIPSRSEANRQSRSSMVSASTNSPQKIRRQSAQSGALEEQTPPGMKPSCSTPSVADSNGTSAASTVHKRVAVQTKETFFKEFTFEPACTIRLDYVGKRVKTEHGALIGFFIGMMETKCTQLTLKEVRNEIGILGWNKCMVYALNEWGPDLRAQLPSTLASYSPIASLVQIGQGVRDLFYIPFNEMRREDGRLIRGLHRGATSFGTSTATAAIDAAQQVVIFVQGIAEFAFDMVTPDLSYRDHRRHNALQYHAIRVPGDIREGASMAYDTVASGIRETARSLHNAAQDDRARSASESQGYIAALSTQKNMMRQILPTVTRTAVVTAKATNQVLSGFKNQLKPDEHQEELHKWRQGAPASSQQHKHRSKHPRQQKLDNPTGH